MNGMVVTLDVSKLSGWLNASAPCRVAREGVGAEGAACGAEEVGGRRLQIRSRSESCDLKKSCTALLYLLETLRSYYSTV